MSFPGLITRLLRSFAAYGTTDGCDVTEYAAHIEREFAITLSVPDVEQLQTLADMVDCVAVRRPELGQAAIWRAVRQITAYEMGVDISELRPDTRYVEDLCC